MDVLGHGRLEFVEGDDAGLGHGGLHPPRDADALRLALHLEGGDQPADRDEPEIGRQRPALGLVRLDGDVGAPIGQPRHGERAGQRPRFLPRHGRASEASAKGGPASTASRSAPDSSRSEASTKAAVPASAAAGLPSLPAIIPASPSRSPAAMTGS